ncbi:MAG: DNA polymerase III subunit alpha [Proteobacteria bacterium]|nr:DNA polymerase III subunit alpha [Pseudomonadota bacterium]
MSDFAHLHLHSQYSLLESSIRLDELFKVAVEDKMSAVGLTDHGNMFGAVDFYLKAKKHGLKPILGCEVYVAPGGRLLRGNTGSGDNEIAPYATGRSGLQHLVLLVQNEIGYQNLCKLVSSGYLEGFYYRPRIDKELLAQHAEGLIATTACLKGEVTSAALNGDMDRAREAALWFKKVFPGRFYLEMQQNGLHQQMMVNGRFQELARDLELPLLATADCHYLRKEDAISQEVLMSIQTGHKMEDMSGASIVSQEFYFKSQQTMKEDFSFCPEAIENTMKIVDSCHFEFRFKDESGKKIYHFPKYEAPKGFTQQEHLIELAKQGLEQRLEETRQYRNRKFTDTELHRYQERLNKELGIINSMGFTGYFLIVQDFIGFAKSKGIPVGPGRGSGAGSLVAYCLRITDLDPIEHGLLFERFLNPERVSLPDFDIDFCMDRRPEVIDYVSNKYGKDCVAQIITFGNLKARGVTRDVGRVMGMQAQEVDPIAKLIPEEINITLKEAFEKEPRLKSLTESDPQVHTLFEICKRIEGLYRHAGIHAAGLVISNRPMVEHCPLYRGKNDELVIQFDMKKAEEIGLIKFDFLGLKTLTFLKKAEELVNQSHPTVQLQLDKIDLRDAKVFELLSRGDTNGIFQLESSGMQDLLRRVKPNLFADIVAITSLYRPGPMEMLDDYVGRKHGQIPIEYDFEELRPILAETYGIMVYQEQVQQIAMRLASYTAGGADLLRRAMGKKIPEEMAKQKAVFLEGAIKNGHDQAKAEKLFDLMANFAGYGFNKSHAAAYSVITCQTAYLKAHYPIIFYASLLSIERENTDNITKYVADANKHGISVLAPDINESETDFTALNENQIRFGLGAIKGVGQIAIDNILETRKKDGPFKDLFEFCSRTSNRVVNKRVVEALVKAGAFDSFGVHRASLFKGIDDALELGASSQKLRDEQQHSFSDLFGEEENSFTHHHFSYPETKPWTLLEKLKYEKETIGFYVTGHPLDDFSWEVQRYTTATIQDCLSFPSNKEVFLAASIVARREIITKRGDRMAFLTLGDKTGEIEAVVFSDIYLESEGTFKSDEPIWVKARLERDENGAKLLLSKRKSQSQALPLRYAFEVLAREMHLFFEDPEKDFLQDSKSVEQLQQFLARQAPADGQGFGPLFFHIQTHPNTTTTLRWKGTVPLRRETVHFIRSLLDERVRVEFR